MEEEIKVSSIEKLTIARQMLAEAKTMDDILHIRDIAEAARVYAKAAKLGLENQNEAAEVKIRAERKAGEMLAQMPKAEGGQPYQSTSNTMLQVDSPPTLEDLGIERMQSSRWQQIASLPEKVFEEFITETKEDGGELTSSSIVRMAKLETSKHQAIPLPMDGKYRVIYADPPWSYGNSMPNYYGVQEDHYPTLSLEQICAIPVGQICEENAVLFLWVTSPILEECFQVVNAWGFKYKASFIWDKEKHVMGHYNSVRHEILLLCTRGSCQPDIHKLFDSVVTEERTDHSRKPEIFRTIIDTLYINGKRIELFARSKHDGWDVYGNEANLS